ncbi:MAG: hypothetical protein NVSMB9_09880 [Isosphaeraceae bacterium]
MKPIGTAEDLQRRLLRAVELVEQGESPDDVAYFLGCGRSSVYTWVKLARNTPEKLAAKPHPGPTPRLSAEQLKELEGLLLKVKVLVLLTMLESVSDAHAHPGTEFTRSHTRRIHLL